MIRSLRVESFKNFRDAELVCGPVTVLVGTNASGKSNLRDAFRFLHGIGRGYNLAGILGEMYGSGGERVWDGIRGGLHEVSYRQAPSFALELTVADLPASQGLPVHYRIEVGLDHRDGAPRVRAESLHCGPDEVFRGYPAENDPNALLLSILGHDLGPGTDPLFHAGYPGVGQFPHRFLNAVPAATREEGNKLARFDELVASFLQVLGRMRFLELSPNAMRQPSTPGQTVLGDHGEHLASVLQMISADPARKAALVSWINSLAPNDVADFRFPKEFSGKVLLALVESGGLEVSAYSASDGTLRFLAIAAALLADKEPHLYFLEELENGIHPARLHLLLDLIERNTGPKTHQVVVTTHSPQLLRLVSEGTLAHTSLVYRLEDQPDGRIQRLLDLPAPAVETLLHKDRALLHESGWFEDAASYLAAEDDA